MKHDGERQSSEDEGMWAMGVQAVESINYNTAKDLEYGGGGRV